MQWTVAGLIPIDREGSPEHSEDSGTGEFPEFFRQSALAGTVKVTGESSAQAIFFHIKFDENLRNPKAIHEGLYKMLGDIGSRMVEKSIVNEMFSRMKQNPPASLNLTSGEFDFVRSVRYVRGIYYERKG